MFSDEVRVALYKCDGRVQFRMRRGERGMQECFKEAVAYGGGSVMFWAGIMAHRRTELVVVPPPALTAARYVEDILTPHVLPISQQVGGFIFQQDNARPHTAAVTTNFLANNNIQTLPHPACSPDLNPIEHAWDMLDRRIRARRPPPRTLQDISQAAVEEWGNIPQEALRKLVHSMPRRCAAVLAARGGNTLY
jgi:transposase